MKQVARVIKKSKWTAAPFYTEVGMAHYWNKMPSELGLCNPEDDPAVMMSYYETSRTMEAYESHLQTQEYEKVRRKGKH